ncbi:MAG: hypothetical protein ABWZ52_03700 [Acidimicrobiales bacterium]
MSRLIRAVIAVLAMGTVFAGPANAAPDEDFVAGTGTIAIPDPINPSRSLLIDVSIDARSGASGENPTGTVVAKVRDFDLVPYSGPVTCLAVNGNTAFVGIADPATGPVIFEVVDNSATATVDTIGVIDADIPGCAPGFSPVPDPLVAGDFVVHDSLALTSKDQCKLGGWRDFTDDEGQEFASQGECIAFVQRDRA